uniref:Platelet-derived growth factor (PDGF) family profile domain-containing protein n=1 Tax=Sinocyclocheilus grahami TaxID=75366 RepID=A0A672KQD9_SINGR
IVCVSVCVSVCVCSVMLFPEAWGRSQCRSLEWMVEVEQEYPGGVEHIYNPGCVPLLRCSGCCNDDKLACFPASTHNISIQAQTLSPQSHTLLFFTVGHIYKESSHSCFHLTVVHSDKHQQKHPGDF